MEGGASSGERWSAAANGGGAQEAAHSLRRGAPMLTLSLLMPRERSRNACRCGFSGDSGRSVGASWFAVDQRENTSRSVGMGWADSRRCAPADQMSAAVAARRGRRRQQCASCLCQCGLLQGIIRGHGSSEC